jgi:hypothetical protein
MKKLVLILVLAVLMTGGGLSAMSTPSYARVYKYPPPPPNLYAYPWVGPNTPWVYYNGDWFLKGMLYYFFGPQYGWAPYYAYPPTHMVRPKTWYAPRWRAWYVGHPHYWQNFSRQYPYWRNHRTGQPYDRQFYEKHHHGQGPGWHKGFQAVSPPPPHPRGRGAGPGQVSPPPRGKPGPGAKEPGRSHEPGHGGPREEGR